ncbi:MAG: acyl-CoA thioesterase [Flavobacteriaceae bacterium]|jgi:acyl-CoA hydrolase|nr:acyl-CoA thioesterase [Pelagibacterales bacterium]MBT4709138.1 acyl-CoA thioesterase [Flavobacteriaceae bacterium]MBT6170714.1 acyl-CoA thioesterase [Flavobacteriaceae bacterium]MBT6447458.1 acyl-CoA thioesterase [Flavobacteriaceae bacterium]MDG1830357.1 acyl-CoA thioesterase [Flavobacteriaceae bacterium]|tara:strand:- start:33 stop:542 length:510 start_codon:yes stop_codon:yes gene_type:complete
MDPKTPENSKTIQTDVVMPGDTNSLNNLFGGELLARMDKVASIAAIKHSEKIVVTASVNNVSFGEPVPNGSILTIEAKVSRAFNSSMEVFIDVWKQNKTNPQKTKVNEAIYTFVALNNKGKTVKVPQIIPETELEKSRYDAALRRRQLSLVLAGKLSPKDATELKALFD